MAIQKIFRTTVPSIRFFCKDGTPVTFVSGKFTTDNKKVEDELMDEVGQIGRSKSKHPYIFVDESEPEVDTEALSPAEQLKLTLKEEARRELLAEFAEAEKRAKGIDAGNSLNTHATSVATTASIAEGETESNAAAPASPAATVAARLANLHKS